MCKTVWRVYLTASGKLLRVKTCEGSGAIAGERCLDVLCRMAPRAGFEPATYPLGGDRAIQLCHRGMGLILASISTIGEPVTTINISMIKVLRKARKSVCKESVQRR